VLSELKRGGRKGSGEGIEAVLIKTMFLVGPTGVWGLTQACAASRPTQNQPYRKIVGNLIGANYGDISVGCTCM